MKEFNAQSCFTFETPKVLMLLIAMIAGWVIGRLHMERHLEEWVLEIQTGGNGMVEEDRTWGNGLFVQKYQIFGVKHWADVL